MIITKLENFYKKHYLIISICVVIFLVIGLVYYYKIFYPAYMDKSYVNNREFIAKKNENHGKPDPPQAILYFFYTEWCPMCLNLHNEWDAFKEHFINSYNDAVFTFIKVDCDKNVDLATEYNITGYPTIKLVYNDTIYEYIDTIKFDQVRLNQFILTILKNPN